jgi:MFS transporter, ACS family, tartrate transporter
MRELSGDPHTAQLAVVNRKIFLRLLPFLSLCFCVAFLDRINVGFAALTMNKDLGFSPYVFGLGGGIFFFGYCLFEIPSNLILFKVGARRWMARIMLTWGIFAIGMAFVTGPTGFYLVRFLLGLSEAGFLPGALLYLTLWVPREGRAFAVSILSAASPLAGLIGSPLSGILLRLDGLYGLAGWQWMFIVEGVPAVLLAFATYFYLPDAPAEAKWLTTAERALLEQTLAAERRQVEERKTYTLLQALLNWRVAALALALVGILMGVYGFVLWLPTIIKSLGHFSDLEISLIGAIPYLVACIGMVWWSHHSDVMQERRLHVAGAMTVAAVALVISAYSAASPTLSLICLTIVITGLLSALSVFWTLPNYFLTGVAAAGGIAIINSIGVLGGFLGPFFVGWIKDSTGDFIYALLALALSVIIGAAIIFLLRPFTSFEPQPSRAYTP